MFNKYSITLMNSEWDVILQPLKVKHIPRVGELIYLSDDKTYYNVISVIHNVSKTHSIFVIVEFYDKKS
jgi:hypothetical protein